MSTVAFSNFPYDEIEDFIGACKRHHLPRDHFLVKAEVAALEAGIQPERREVLVVYQPTAVTRRYNGGHGSHWTADFERDLASRVFQASQAEFDQNAAPVLATLAHGSPQGMTYFKGTISAGPVVVLAFDIRSSSRMLRKV